MFPKGVFLPGCVGKPDQHQAYQRNPVKALRFATFGVAVWGTVQDKVAVIGIYL